MTFSTSQNETPAAAGDILQSAWANTPGVELMDSEMAASLRMHLHAVFSGATCWEDLSAQLRKRGFYLRTAKSRLWLCDRTTRAAICSCRFLGFPSRLLSSRFGTGD